MTSFDINPTELAELTGASDSDLLANIGRIRGRGAMGKDPIEQGREIFLNLRKKIRLAVCQNRALRAAYHGVESGSSPLVIAALADLIAGYLNGIAAASFCILLIREGIPDYCAEIWNDPHEGKSNDTSDC